MEPDQINTTEEEAYRMARSVALHSLSKIVADEETNVGNRIWAAEIVLDHGETKKVKSGDGAN